jgi:hypothetical protein
MAENTEAMTIVEYTGLAGLKLFVENGGSFNPEARTRFGKTEATVIAEHAGIEGMKFFVENGGQFNSAVKNSLGHTEAMTIVEYTGAEGLKLFVENGGLLDPNNRREVSVVKECLKQDAHKAKIEAGNREKAENRVKIKGEAEKYTKTIATRLTPRKAP